MVKSVNPPASHRRQYPWEAWCDGTQRRAIQGSDFSNTAEAFRSAGAQWARANGHTWQATIEGPTSVLFTLTRAVQ